MFDGKQVAAGRGGAGDMEAVRARPLLAQRGCGEWWQQRKTDKNAQSKGKTCAPWQAPLPYFRIAQQAPRQAWGCSGWHSECLPSDRAVRAGTYLSMAMVKMACSGRPSGRSAKTGRDHVQLAALLAARRRLGVLHGGETLLQGGQHLPLGAALEQLGDEGPAWG